MNQKDLPVLFFGAGLPQVAALSGDAKSYAERLFHYPAVGALEEKDAETAIRQPIEGEGEKIDDDAIVPDKFKTASTVISINNAALKQSLVDGEAVDGAHLEYKTSLTIR